MIKTQFYTPLSVQAEGVKGFEHAIFFQIGKSVVIKGAEGVGKSSLIALYKLLTGEKVSDIKNFNSEVSTLTHTLAKDGVQYDLEFDIIAEKLSLKRAKQNGVDMTKKSASEIISSFQRKSLDFQKLVNLTGQTQVNELIENLPALKQSIQDAQNILALAINKRTVAKKDAEIKANIGTPEIATYTDITVLNAEKEQIRAKLNQLYKENKENNDKLRKEYNEKVNVLTEKVAENNKEIEMLNLKIENLNNDLNVIKNICELRDWVSFVDFGKIESDINSQKTDKVVMDIEIEKAKIEKPILIDPEVPSRDELDKIETAINLAGVNNEKYENYQKWLKKKDEYDKAIQYVKLCEMEVIEKRKELYEILENFQYPVSDLKIKAEVDENGTSSMQLQYKGIPLSKDTPNEAEKLKLFILWQINTMKEGELGVVYLNANGISRNSIKELAEKLDGLGIVGLFEKLDDDIQDLTVETIIKN